MKKETIYDIIGIGIGPFNLGLAALTHNIPELKCKFFDQNQSFNWHAGLLLPGTRLQVPFYADLVTLADPRSQFSFMSFLKAKSRMIRFAIQENNFVTRKEYNQYCQWAVAQLPSLLFGIGCEAIHFSEEKNCYEVYVRETNGFSYLFHGKNIILGVGTVSSVPDCTEDLNHPFVFHSSEYLFKKEKLLTQEKVALIGSGQSAAEIFYDLLQYTDLFESLSWFTRSEYPYPMDSSRFAFEMTSPDYIQYFYELSSERKKEILASQDRLYKGINKVLLDAIHDKLYLDLIHQTSCRTEIYPNCELRGVKPVCKDRLNLEFRHRDQERDFHWVSDNCILATGYKNMVPGFLDPVKELINWNEDGFYSVNRNYSIDMRNSIFVQNADLHSHGFNSADLGMGPYRNATILNQILGWERFPVERNIVFQSFGMPFK
jgi:lysine N6-hydroxylase